MRKILLITFLVVVSIQTLSAQPTAEKNKNNTAVLRHVVMFKFQDKATPADIKKVEEALSWNLNITTWRNTAVFFLFFSAVGCADKVCIDAITKKVNNSIFRI